MQHRETNTDGNLSLFKIKFVLFLLSCRYNISISKDALELMGFYIKLIFDFENLFLGEFFMCNAYDEESSRNAGVNQNLWMFPCRLKSRQSCLQKFFPQLVNLFYSHFDREHV